MASLNAPTQQFSHVGVHAFKSKRCKHHLNSVHHTRSYLVISIVISIDALLCRLATSIDTFLALLALSVLAQKFADPPSRTATACNKRDNGLQFRTLGPLCFFHLDPPGLLRPPLQPWLTHQFPRGGPVPAGHLVPDAHTSTPLSIPTHTNKP